MSGDAEPSRFNLVELVSSTAVRLRRWQTDVSILNVSLYLVAEGPGGKCLELVPKGWAENLGSLPHG